MEDAFDADVVAGITVACDSIGSLELGGIGWHKILDAAVAVLRVRGVGRAFRIVRPNTSRKNVFRNRPFFRNVLRPNA